jgi:hypothetical protein
MRRGRRPCSLSACMVWYVTDLSIHVLAVRASFRVKIRLQNKGGSGNLFSQKVHVGTCSRIESGRRRPRSTCTCFILTVWLDKTCRFTNSGIGSRSRYMLTHVIWNTGRLKLITTCTYLQVYMYRKFRGCRIRAPNCDDVTSTLSHEWRIDGNFCETPPRPEIRKLD